MLSKKVAILATALSVGASMVQAASVGYTEGKRDLVAGTTALAPKDASSGTGSAFDLVSGLGGVFGEGDSINLHGRIVGAIDTFTFEFVSSVGFQVSFIFGGYELHNGGTVNESGFVAEPGSAPKIADFFLLASDLSVVDSAEFTTDVTEVADNGGTDIIFSAGPGTYYFRIDGTEYRRADDGSKPKGLYDIRISSVPLPASALLLIAGIGGLGVAARQKR